MERNEKVEKEVEKGVCGCEVTRMRRGDDVGDLVQPRRSGEWGSSGDRAFTQAP